ncbi:unnamed protein product [Hyaloperonospora brassicae]|uniref:DUF4604 domain-containing protein n=1 Tax=Hyaloperonospora brassicae TaxID=162125 RepID=A0AAV0UBD0_HYABA|nr:unnamed protein product [Hyaloperonospora brassicae]
MDDDNNCEDSRVRGWNAGGSSGKARGKGPQFTRVIPKFLQKYHQAPAIQAKFATLPKLSDEEEAELDDVQQAAIDEYVATTEKKKEKGRRGEDKEKGSMCTGDVDDDRDGKKRRKRDSTRGQSIVQMGTANTLKNATKKTKTKRIQSDRPALCNNKLLSFSMDDA